MAVHDPNDAKSLGELLDDMRRARARERDASHELTAAISSTITALGSVRESLAKTIIALEEVKESLGSVSLWSAEREDALRRRDDVQTAIIARLVQTDPTAVNGSGQPV